MTEGLFRGKHRGERILRWLKHAVKYVPQLRKSERSVDLRQIKQLQPIHGRAQKSRGDPLGGVEAVQVVGVEGAAGAGKGGGIKPRLPQSDRKSVV